MKISILACLWTIPLALTAFGQSDTPAPPSPPPTPQLTATASVAPSVAATVTPSVSPTPDEEDAIERTVKAHLKKHFNVTVNGHQKVGGDADVDAGALMAIPIVGIIFTTLFGAPVLVVAAIMFFSYLKARSLHRTVRTMVEKGQEVPAALFANATPVVKARSDMRRGVILTMVGLGLIIFLAAENHGFRGGEWSIGVIPLMIGAGYLLVWKLEGRKDNDRPLV
jgi:hypothetical protein